MTYTDAQNKAYELSQLNDDSHLVFGPILENDTYVIAGWDTRNYTKTEFKGGHRTVAERIL